MELLTISKAGKKLGVHPNSLRTDAAKARGFTVCGEFFPETYPVPRPDKWSRGEEDPLTTEMRLFSSCSRWAFNRLQDGRARKELKQQGQQLFGLNSRYADDAILKAKEIIASQRQLLVLQSEETGSKLKRAKKKLHWAKKSLEKAFTTGDAADISRAKRAVHGRAARVRKLAERLRELQAQQTSGTIPKVVFGGQALWKRVCTGRATREKYLGMDTNPDGVASR